MEDSGLRYSISHERILWDCERITEINVRFLRDFGTFGPENPAKDKPNSLALFAGAFHPPTVAHWALAEAACGITGAVLWVLPEHFPHKSWDQVALQQRADLLLALTAQAPGRHGVALVQSNLFFDMAAEVQSHTGAGDVRILTGEDGAQRLVEWDYGLGKDGQHQFLREGLARFGLLSARRSQQTDKDKEAAWRPPEALAPFLQWLDLLPEHAGVSSTLVRSRIASGLDWKPLVPERIQDQVERLYGSTSS